MWQLRVFQCLSLIEHFFQKINIKTQHNDANKALTFLLGELVQPWKNCNSNTFESFITTFIGRNIWPAFLLQ